MKTPKLKQPGDAEPLRFGEANEPEAAEAPKAATPAPEGAEEERKDDERGAYVAQYRSWIKRN